MTVDTLGNAYTWDGGSWSSARVDSSGSALEFDGAWKLSAWSARAPADRHGPLVSVSCVSATWCLAVDENGNAIRFDGSGWSARALIDPAGQLTVVSCAAVDRCVAVDAHGNALVSDGDPVDHRAGEPVGAGVRVLSVGDVLRHGRVFGGVDSGGRSGERRRVLLVEGGRRA